VLERIGPLDERFEVGFFEDDVLCVRAREVGFRLVAGSSQSSGISQHAPIRLIRLVLHLQDIEGKGRRMPAARLGLCPEGRSPWQ
jgi:hypothetical protein